MIKRGRFRKLWNDVADVALQFPVQFIKVVAGQKSADDDETVAVKVGCQSVLLHHELPAEAKQTRPENSISVIPVSCF
jgi:hypothetical protein